MQQCQPLSTGAHLLKDPLKQLAVNHSRHGVSVGRSLLRIEMNLLYLVAHPQRLDGEGLTQRRLVDPQQSCHVDDLRRLTWRWSYGQQTHRSVGR